MFNTTNFSTKLIAFTFSVTLLLAGCSNPASNDDEDHDEEHPEPYSVEFIMDGDPIVTYADGSVTGQFNIESQSQTSTITAEFFDEDGHEIHTDELGDEYYLDWTIDNSDHATIERAGENDQWSFHITGETAGETTVQFFMEHDGHDVFNTPEVGASNAIQIVVEEPSN